MKLKSEENHQENIVTILIDGSIDTVTAPELEKYLEKFYASVVSIILDFADVSYISSSGLRVLLRADSAMSSRGTFALKNVNADVKEVLQLTGFSDLLKIME